MLVYGLISPHPPIILPDVGGADTLLVAQTIAALTLAADRVGQSSPDRVIIISPHEGHGFDVPLYYLNPHLAPKTQIERILVTQASYRYYYELGQAAGAKVRVTDERVAIVASGDLSHVLKADGPYGFNAAGPVLDDAIVRAVTAHDDDALLNLDPKTLTDGAECGLRSILFLLGAVKGAAFKPRVLSYEGPLGVGYMVTTYEPGENQ